MVAIAMVQNMTISSFQCIKAFGFAWKKSVDTVTYSDIQWHKALIQCIPQSRLLGKQTYGDIQVFGTCLQRGGRNLLTLMTRRDTCTTLGTRPIVRVGGFWRSQSAHVNDDAAVHLMKSKGGTALCHSWTTTFGNWSSEHVQVPIWLVFFYL